jgi:hydrogenase maturation factor
MNVPRSFSLLCFAVLLYACGQRSGQRKEEDVRQVSLNGITIPENVLIEIEQKSGKGYRKYMQVNEVYDSTGYGDVDTIHHGIFFSRLKEETAKEICLQFHESVKSSGNFIFCKNMGFVEDTITTFDVVIIKARDLFDVLRFVRIEGGNYNLDTEDILQKVREWNEQYSFKLLVADTDRMEAMMDNPPADMEKFADEVYAFCPDVIDQGYGTKEALVEYYRKNSYLWLWWD